MMNTATKEVHPIELTVEEERAIASLQRLAKRWPKSLWLYSASGTLTVMRTAKDGTHAVEGGVEGAGIDRAYIITTIQGISNDGGDW